MTTPTARDTSSAIGQEIFIASFSWTNTAMPTPAVTPADRSISASRITNTSATASIARNAVCVMRFATFSRPRKSPPLRNWNRTQSTMKPPMAGSIPISPERTREM